MDKLNLIDIYKIIIEKLKEINVETFDFESKYNLNQRDITFSSDRHYFRLSTSADESYFYIYCKSKYNSSYNYFNRSVAYNNCWFIIADLIEFVKESK